MKLERLVKPYYDALEEGKVLARRCLECGAIEFPPHYACNKCGNYETEWYEISGKARIHSIVMPAALSSKPEYKNLGKYAYCEIELEEGTHLNAVVRGINKKKRQELMDKLPEVYCHAAIFEREQGFKTVVFDLDEGQ